jgi:hypothetical protein
MMQFLNFLDIISGCEDELFSGDLLMTDDTDFGLLSNMNSTPFTTPIKEESMPEFEIKQEVAAPPFPNSNSNNSPHQRAQQVLLIIIVQLI